MGGVVEEARGVDGGSRRIWGAGGEGGAGGAGGCSSRNVLLSGPGLRVKVSDFGLARKFKGDGWVTHALTCSRTHARTQARACAHIHTHTHTHTHTRAGG